MKTLLIVACCLFTSVVLYAQKEEKVTKTEKIVVVITKKKCFNDIIIKNRVRYPSTVFIYRYKNQRIDKALNFITKDTEVKAA
ncbi:hypothetical protein [Croceivirga sp. JEA036]|uniref:hypothetical protein n=1 Tax=Croceivirga sp. JEA036 TaxID=2721162 RepID=UPI00143CB655|nr:hypothetical protein [Croceivirga sp. JEA036]NJB37584.1 hypothetical protein [Croceivirga sp. JEA036]